MWLAAPASAAPEVVVCTSHHHVLPYWLSAWRAGRLGRAGAVVHFDAHPDLAPPAREPRPEHPLAAVDIASFQLAAAWWGVVDRIVWVRPAWAHQLPDGPRRFQVGLVPEGGLRVSDSADYWLLDERYAPESALARPAPVALQVSELDRATEGLEVEGPWILDVDLDGFATRNPGADRLRAAGAREETIATLRRAFDPAGLPLPRAPGPRLAAMRELLQAARGLGAGPGAALVGAFRLWRLGLSARDLATLGWAIATEIRLSPDDLAADGRYAVGLPEHRTPAAELPGVAEAVAGLVAAVGRPPVLVTISRSVDDGYTPRDAWPLAEWSTLRALAEVLPDAQVRLDAGLRPAPRIAALPAVHPRLEATSRRQAAAPTPASSSTSTGASPSRP